MSYPQPFSLGQNFPNPFNPSTVIPFTVPREGKAELTINNALGQRIRTLVSGHVSTGSHSVTWDGRDGYGAGVSAGVYLFRLVFGEEGITRKMLLLDWNTGNITQAKPNRTSPAVRLPKPAAETFTVNITGADIEPFTRKGITLVDGNTYEYMVTRKKTILNGIAFVSIPGGTFQMGDEKGDLLLSCRPIHTVTVSPFRMSETEITNAQYAAYLTAAYKKGDIGLAYDVVSAAKGANAGQNLIYLADHWDADNRCWINFSGNTFPASITGLK